MRISPPQQRGKTMFNEERGHRGCSGLESPIMDAEEVETKRLRLGDGVSVEAGREEVQSMWKSVGLV